MSLDASKFVWDSAFSSPAIKLVALCLADMANESGECWPKYSTIAKRCGIHERWARRCVSQLKSSGVLASAKRFQNKLQQSNMYTFAPAVLAAYREGSQAHLGGSTSPPGEGAEAQGGWAYRPTGGGSGKPPESLSESPNESKKNQGKILDFGLGKQHLEGPQLNVLLFREFEQFWTAYKQGQHYSRDVKFAMRDRVTWNWAQDPETRPNIAHIVRVLESQTSEPDWDKMAPDPEVYLRERQWEKYERETAELHANIKALGTALRAASA